MGSNINVQFLLGLFISKGLSIILSEAKLFVGKALFNYKTTEKYYQIGVRSCNSQTKVCFRRDYGQAFIYTP